MEGYCYITEQLKAMYRWIYVTHIFIVREVELLNVACDAFVAEHLRDVSCT